MYSHHSKKRRKHFRYGCFGATWPMHPMKMAYAYGYAVPDDSSDEVEASDDRGKRSRDTWYAQREHRGRRGHRSGSFGVRRPLRYLSYQLDLHSDQLLVVDEITENAIRPEVCDPGNLVHLLRLVRRAGKQSFDPLPLEALPAQVCDIQYIDKGYPQGLFLFLLLMDLDSRREELCCS